MQILGKNKANIWGGEWGNYCANIGQIFGKYCANIGKITGREMGKHWVIINILLSEYCANILNIMGKYWANIGQILCKY